MRPPKPNRVSLLLFGFLFFDAAHSKGQELPLCEEPRPTPVAATRDKNLLEGIHSIGIQTLIDHAKKLNPSSLSGALDFEESKRLVSTLNSLTPEPRLDDSQIEILFNVISKLDFSNLSAETVTLFKKKYPLLINQIKPKFFSFFETHSIKLDQINQPPNNHYLNTFEVFSHLYEGESIPEAFYRDALSKWPQPPPRISLHSKNPRSENAPDTYSLKKMRTAIATLLYGLGKNPKGVSTETLESIVRNTYAEDTLHSQAVVSTDSQSAKALAFYSASLLNQFPNTVVEFGLLGSEKHKEKGPKKDQRLARDWAETLILGASLNPFQFREFDDAKYKFFGKLDAPAYVSSTYPGDSAANIAEAKRIRLLISIGTQVVFTNRAPERVIKEKPYESISSVRSIFRYISKLPEDYDKRNPEGVRELLAEINKMKPENLSDLRKYIDSTRNNDPTWGRAPEWFTQRLN